MKQTYINLRFLKFRTIQTRKFLKDIPFPYLILLLLIAATALYAINALLRHPAGAPIYATLLIVTVAACHRHRRDYHFIHLIDERPARVFLTDYLLFTLPLLLPLLYHGQAIAVAAVAAACAVISRIKQPYRKTPKGFPVPPIIPAKAFEVRTLIRRKGWLLLAFHLAACAALPLPIVSFIPLWLSLTLLYEELRQCEPIALLNICESPPKPFLHKKLRSIVGIYTLSAAPVCLIYALLHPSQWPLPLLFLTLAVLNVMLCVAGKYAFYEPGQKIVAAQNSIALSLIAIFIPLLSPLTLFLLIRYYTKAIKTLTPYLYAYN
jgi:hypothetical protein